MIDCDEIHWQNSILPTAAVVASAKQCRLTALYGWRARNVPDRSPTNEASIDLRPFRFGRMANCTGSHFINEEAEVGTTNAGTRLALTLGRWINSEWLQH